MKPDLSINWFDFTTVAVIIIGVMVGRKRGMSVELLALVQWLLIIFLGAMAYDPLGRALADFTSLGPVFSFVTAYLLVAAGIKIVFVVLKRMTGEKLLGSDTFGGYEYYLGMVAGGVRFLCILLFALALLNAPQVSQVELDKQLRAQKENLGAIYFPPFGNVQRYILDGSITGRLVKQYLPAQLIHVDPSAGSGPSGETIYRAREREVNEVIGPKSR
jgi:uncharacterized membrane protein required for colicin V production